MNLTLRAITNRRTLIVKQSRPWVEKYDHIPAPWGRIEYEHRFYQRIANVPAVASRMPQLLHADMQARVLVLQDLGDAPPLTSLYSGQALPKESLQQLAGYLAALHDATCGSTDPGFENREMRQLNHQHIFEIPLAEHNGIDLEHFETGLAAAAARLREDPSYQARLGWAADRYLATGPVLIHGDYFPGSWLRTAGGIFVIDPEFCFYGDPEFDLACAVAHLRLARQPLQHAHSFLQEYVRSRGGIAIDSATLSGFAAAEVMRRLIGVAQLPLPKSGGQRARLLERSRLAMIDGAWEELWD